MNDFVYYSSFECFPTDLKYLISLNITIYDKPIRWCPLKLTIRTFEPIESNAKDTSFVFITTTQKRELFIN
jgi:hypothetical protein